MYYFIVKPQKDLKVWKKSILRAIKVQIREILGNRPPYLDKYYKEYRKVFKNSYKIVTKRILLNEILKTNLIFIGDFHTLKRAQEFQLEVINFLNKNKKEVVLYLEPFAFSDKKILDEYLKGKINEEFFLYKIKYKKNWGFEWENYKILLNYAKEKGIEVYGINLKEDASLIQRDKFAGKFISEKIKENQKKTHLVIIGDLHLAPNHLPLEVLKNYINNLSYLIIYQNSETIFLKEMEKGEEKNLKFVQINPKSFCVFNTPPWEKYQSWLAYLLRSKIVEDRNFDDLALTLLEKIGKIYNKKWEVNLEVKTFEEIDFLPELLGVEDSYPFFNLIQKNYPVYIPKLDIIWLPFPDLLNFVEELSHFIFYKENKIEKEHIFQEENLLNRIFYYSFGYINTKMLFEERKTQSIRELKKILKEKSDERAEKKLERLKIAIPYILKIFRNMNYLNKNKTSLHLLDQKLCFTITRRIGYLIGEKIFNEFKTNKIKSKEILYDLSNPKFFFNKFIA